MTQDNLRRILDLVKQQRGLDFSGYRPNLLTRRVMVRVRTLKKEDLNQYCAYLKSHPEEYDYLLDALTINVTEFFRDGHVFDELERKVLPELIKRKKESGSKRVSIWSCPCSSGEEPYSVLMLLAEFLGSRLADYRVKVIATDIDQQSLISASQGVFEASQFKNVSPERMRVIENYFYKIGHKYWIREDWPPYIDFKYHDVIADIPFEHVDLILCRNLLMYFDRSLQEQVIMRFWNALNPAGFLVLGLVESLTSGVKDLFIEFSSQKRIYQKR